MRADRTRASLINMAVSLGGQLFTTVLTFAGRILFVRFFAMEYLGINGLFTNILSILSLAELGIGNAMIYSLYKPIAYDDEDRIRRLMNLYRILYRYVAVFVAAAGLLLLPFLNLLIREDPGIPHLRFIYLLFLTDSVSTYLFGYKQSIIMASQRDYITKLYINTFKSLQVVVQIVILIITRNYYLYLGIQIACSILPNMLLAKKADEMFPYLQKDTLSQPELAEKKEIFKNMAALTMHRIGSTAVNSTDNLIISAMIGLGTVGIYSNYKLITNTLKNLLAHFYRAFTASIGNAAALEGPDKIMEIYKALNFMLFVIFGYCSVCMFLLVNPFIELMFGEEYLLGMPVVTLICADFYLTGMRQITLRFRDAYGLFWRDRYKPLAESALNLLLSLALVRAYGISGILIGTIASNLLTNFWVEPYMLMRYGIEEGWKQKLMGYYSQYLKNTLVMVCLCAALYALCRAISLEGMIGILIKGMAVTALYLGGVFVIYMRSEEQRAILGRINNIIRRRKYKL